MVFQASWISLLVVMNLSLQVWDGLATYYGLALGVQEGNPLLRSCMEYWGVGVTLVGAKSAACVLLVFSVRIWGEVLFPQPWGEEMHVEGGMRIDALQDVDEVDVRINPLQSARGDEALHKALTNRAPLGDTAPYFPIARHSHCVLLKNKGHPDGGPFSYRTPRDNNRTLLSHRLRSKCKSYQIMSLGGCRVLTVRESTAHSSRSRNLMIWVDVQLLTENRVFRSGSIIPDKQKGQPHKAALFIAVKLKTSSLYAAFAAGAGIFSGAGFSSNGVVFHLFSSGRTCFTKHRMLRSASSNGIPA